MNDNGFAIRLAEEKDCGLILEFITALAVFEKMEDQVVATEEGLRDSIFRKQQAEVLIGEENGTPVGFCLFFTNYSTFVGRANLYLEDLFVRPEHRGKGYGEALLRRLAAVAVERGCQRVDWWCLNWNTGAAGFYKKMGAVPMDQWTTFRLEGDALRDCAANSSCK